MKSDISFDAYHIKILSVLQSEGRLAINDVAVRIGLSTTPTWNRVKDLERLGVIAQYAAVLDRQRVGLGMCVLAEVNLHRHGESTVEAFEQAVRDCPAIIECQSTTGQADYRLKVVTPDMRQYDSFLHEVIFKLPGVREIRSSVVLRDIKKPSALPLDHLGSL